MYLTNVSFKVIRGWAGGSQRHKDREEHSGELHSDRQSLMLKGNV